MANPLWEDTQWGKCEQHSLMTATVRPCALVEVTDWWLSHTYSWVAALLTDCLPSTDCVPCTDGWLTRCLHRACVWMGDWYTVCPVLDTDRWLTDFPSLEDGQVQIQKKTCASFILSVTNCILNNLIVSESILFKILNIPFKESVQLTRSIMDVLDLKHHNWDRSNFTLKRNVYKYNWCLSEPLNIFMNNSVRYPVLINLIFLSMLVNKAMKQTLDNTLKKLCL